MKKFFFLLLSLYILSISGFAQSKSNKSNDIIKMNLFSLALRNYNITYERQIGKRFSASLGVRYMPQTGIPFKSTSVKVGQRFIDLTNFYIDQFKLGNTAFTGEFRWYAGSGPLKGFYIAPYFRYSTLDLVVPLSNPSSIDGGVTYDPILFSGKIVSKSAGLMFGVQSNLSKRLVLDLWIIGGHIGSNNGLLTSNEISPSMNKTAEGTLQENLNSLNASGFVKIENRIISSTSAEIKTSGGWLGLRVFSLSLGYRF